MKLATYVGPLGPEPRVGAVSLDEESLVDLAAAAARLEGRCPNYMADMASLLDAWEGGRPHVAHLAKAAMDAEDEGLIVPIDQVRLLAPVPRPRTLRDCMSFERHLINAMRTVAKWKFGPVAALDRGLERFLGRGFLRPPKVWYDRPVYYKGNPHSVVGPDAEVPWPPWTKRLDFELEFGIYIGRRGCDIAPERALDYIAGYTIFNDFSARDVQLREMQARLGPAKGKDFNSGNAMGPYLVTPDEVPDPQALTTCVRVNGQEWSQGTTADLQHSFADMIAFISQGETLYPGDFIGAGTIPGGCGLELDRWIQPGDVVELDVERLGVLRNRVVEAARVDAQE